MRNFSPRDKSIAICDGQAPEDGDLPQKCAERFLKKPSELEIQAEEWKTVPWVWEKLCNISDLFTLFGLKFWKVSSFTRERSKRNLNLGPEFSVGAVRKWSSLSASFSHPLAKYACVLLWRRAEPWARSDAARARAQTKLNWSIINLGSRSTATTAAVQKKFAVSLQVLHGQQWLRVRQEVARKQFSSPDRAPTCWRRVVAGRFHFGGASRPQLRWSTTASWVGDSVIAARIAHWAKRQGPWTCWRGQIRMARGRDCIPQACLRIAINRRPCGHAAGSERYQATSEWPLGPFHRKRWWLADNHDHKSPVSQSALFHA